MSEHIPCWIVWATSSRTGQPDLRAICTERTRANIYRKSIAHNENEAVIRVWVEESWLDHLYGWGMLHQVDADIIKSVRIEGEKLAGSLRERNETLRAACAAAVVYLDRPDNSPDAATKLLAYLRLVLTNNQSAPERSLEEMHDE